MKWLVERNRRLGRTSIVSLLLAMVSMAPAVAQDGAFPDLEIVGASFTNPVEPGGSVTVEVTARNAGTVLVMGTETSNSGYMIDLVLSTDAHVPAGFTPFDASFGEDVLLAGGRISNTRDLNWEMIPSVFRIVMQQLRRVPLPRGSKALYCRWKSQPLYADRRPQMPALTPEELDHFENEGYVVVKDVIDPVQTLDPVIAEYATVLDRLADELYQRGDIASRYEELDFSARYIQICVETGKVHSAYFDFSLPFQNVQPDSPFWAGPAVFSAFTDSDLLDAVESLIGPEIYSNPVQHVRIKPPERHLPKNQYGNPVLGATQWHQDHGVVTEEADDTKMLTVWFSLQDTPFDKGPLMVVPRSHKNGLLPHCPNYMDNAPQFAGAAQIPEKLFAAAEAIPLPITRGDVIFVHKQTVHGSYSNTSDEVRWSFDLRYNPTDQPTGRIAFPGFIARSRRDPQSELRDPAEWHRLWLETRTKMATINQGGQTDIPFRREQLAEHPLCA